MYSRFKPNHINKHLLAINILNTSFKRQKMSDLIEKKKKDPTVNGLQETLQYDIESFNVKE